MAVTERFRLQLKLMEEASKKLQEKAISAGKLNDK